MTYRLVHSWVLLFILLITILIFSPALSQSFVSWDDEGHVTENLHVRDFSWTNLVDTFRSDVNRTYIPLTTVTFSIEHFMFGYNPFFYHLDNILLHGMVVVLIYWIALRLGLTSAAAGLGALLFAVHPMHVESVVWVTQRKDVLYSLFYCASLLCYVFYIQKGRGIFFVLAVLAGLFSILAKPMAMSLPFVLFSIDWFLKRKWNIRLVVEKIPFAITIFSIAWLTYAMNMRGIDFQFPQSLLTWIWCCVFYVVKFIFPVQLSVLYSLPKPVNLSNPEFLLPCLFLIISGLLLFWFRKNRIVLFAAGYYFLSIFFILRFDDGADLTFVADRFMYLPSLGFCLLGGWGLQEFLNWAGVRKISWRVSSLVLASMFLALTFLTVSRVHLWGSELLLWKDAAGRNPGAVVFSQMGNYYLKNNDFQTAMQYYQKAMAINPSYNKPVSNYGMALVKLGLYREAIDVFTHALSLENQSPAVIYNNRGYAYLRLGQNGQARTDFDLAIGADSKYLPVYLNRATLFKNEKDYSRCREDLNTVLRLDPVNAVAKNNIKILERIKDENAAR